MDKFNKFYDTFRIFIAKKGLLCAAIVIVFFTAVLAGLFVKLELVPIKLDGAELKSSFVEDDEKLIDNEADKQGIFTYGPYINLKKGSYTVTLYYETDEDRIADCSRGYGAVALASNVFLSKNKESCDFQIKLDSDINDKSFEVRTMYNGSGRFYVKGVEISSYSVNYIRLIYILSFIAVSLLALFLFRKDGKFRLGYIVYAGIFYVILFSSIGDRIFNIAAITIAFVAAMYAIYFRLEDIPKEIKGTELVEEGICALIASYLYASTINMRMTDEIISSVDFIRNISLSTTLLMVVLIFNFIVLVRMLMLNRHITYWATELAVIATAFTMLTSVNRSVYFAAGIVAIAGIFTYYMCRDNKLGLDNLKLNKNIAFAMVCIGFVLFSAVFGIQSVARYRTFSASNFDLGIFAQMYENMARTGMPITTVERNELMSHFYIHFSPIYYTLLPLYYIFRTPEYLLIMQSILVGLGVFPLFFLCCKKSDNYFAAVIIAYIYLYLPGLIGPLFYDFHENAFLPLMLMSLLYFFETKRYKPMYVFAALTLLIKEDAAIYVLSIALFYIFARKEYKHGCILFLVAGCYFGIVMTGIAHFGKGLMDSHYGMYYLPNESGVGTMFKNMFLCPGLVVSTVFSEDTLEFILYTTGVLLFIPLMSKKLSYLWLTVPYLLVNLVTSYGYQHDIGYQYTFGTVTLLMFLYVLNAYTLRKQILHTVAITTLIACVCGVYTYKGNLYFTGAYNENKASYEQTEELLENVPDGVSITADTFMIPHLYKHSEVYQYPYDKELTDYYILQPGYSQDYYTFAPELEDMGYIKIADNGRVAIFKAPTAVGMKTN
jgi:uncharacterized membrane protein